MAKISFQYVLNVISDGNLSLPDLKCNLDQFEGRILKENKVVYRQEAGLLLKVKKG